MNSFLDSGGMAVLDTNILFMVEDSCWKYHFKSYNAHEAKLTAVKLNWVTTLSLWLQGAEG